MTDPERGRVIMTAMDGDDPPIVIEITAGDQRFAPIVVEVANGDADSVAAGLGEALRQYAAKSPATARTAMPASALGQT
jgi:hypothetical protein